jgi:hypothetical protein
MATIIAILIVLILNAAFAVLTKSFYSEVLETKNLFCKKWIKILFLIPPFGIIGIASVVIVASLFIAFVSTYMVLIEPLIEGFQDYFKKC